MPLETATYISELVTANPAHTDGLNQADSHMRLTKAALKATFPGFTAAPLAATQAQLDAAVASLAGTGYYRFLMGTAALPAITPVGDPNTGIYSPAADQLGFSVGGLVAAIFGTSQSLTLYGPLSAPAVAAAGAYSGGTGQLVPIGAVLEWYDDVLPAEGGYAWANGQIIGSAVTVCPVLLARWGTRFGGNGVTTMGVPDRRETAGVGKSTMGATSARGLTGFTAQTVLGAQFGAATNVLSTVNLPPYTPSGTVGAPVISNPSGSVVVTNGTIGNSAPAGGGSALSPSTSNGAFYVAALQASAPAYTGVAQGGTSTPFSNITPSTVCNYIIRIG